MSKARLVITAVTVEYRPVADYGVARSWVYELLARYRDEGEAAFEPRSKRGVSDLLCKGSVHLKGGDDGPCGGGRT